MVIVDGSPSPASSAEDVMDDEDIEDIMDDDDNDDSGSVKSFYAPTEIDAEIVDGSKSPTSTLDSVNLDLADNAPKVTKKVTTYLNDIVASTNRGP